ncbi:MAG: hypothetical protein ACR2K6_10675 [Solirubrobacterales bacterium]
MSSGRGGIELDGPGREEIFWRSGQAYVEQFFRTLADAGAALDTEATLTSPASASG